MTLVSPGTDTVMKDRLEKYNLWTRYHPVNYLYARESGSLHVTDMMRYLKMK